MDWFRTPWFGSEWFDAPWWHALLDEGQGGSYITFGYGESASKTAMLGLTPGAAAGFTGSYITFGYGESASKTAMLGLAPAATSDFVGSYTTLGQGQNASLFLRLGLGIGGTVVPPEPPIIIPTPGGGYQFIFADKRSRILREDEDIMAFLASVLQSGLLH